MRADRLLSMLWLLRAHGGLSTAELARRLEVSRRTVLRDVEALSAAGVPVWCERGPHGGVRLTPGYRLDVTALSREESRALFASATMWGASSLGLGDALASALRKLLAAVPEEYRSGSAEISSRVLIDPQGWLPQPDSERTGAVFRTIQEAVLARHRLRIVRRRGTGTMTGDTVDPHGLVAAGHSWYLCSSLDDELLFTRISRILEAEIMDETCPNDDGFDLADAWRQRREDFLARFDALTATAWVLDARMRDVHEWVLHVSEAGSHGVPPDDRGWNCLELGFMDRLHAMTVLLRLGPDVCVLAPGELRRELVDRLDRTRALYPVGSGADSDHGGMCSLPADG